MTFGCQTFLGLMVIESRTIHLSYYYYHSIILARSSIVLLANTALETLPSRFINTLMLGRPTRLYFDSVSAIMMGETKQFLMVKLSSLSAYYLILVSWWMPVLETSTNLGQMRKMHKRTPIVDSLACTHPP